MTAESRTVDESSLDARDARADYMRARDLLLKVRELAGGKRLAMALYAAIGESDPSGYPTLLGLIPQAEAFLGEHERGRFKLYDQVRPDDCMRATLSTVLQVPIEEVPDPRIDERLAAGEDPAVIDAEARAELSSWLAARGLRLARQATPPVDRQLWIGVSAGAGLFSDHTVVMSHERILHDPAANWPAPAGTHVEPVGQITAGYTIEEAT